MRGKDDDSGDDSGDGSSQMQLNVPGGCKVYTHDASLMTSSLSLIGPRTLCQKHQLQSE